MSPPSVLIVGTGLIGTSVALAVRAGGGAAPYLLDADPTVAARAAELGAGVVGAPPEPVDVAVVCVPPGAVASVVAEVRAGGWARTCTDVSSVKAAVVAAVERAGDASTFVGGHPVAGRERSGPGAARADLFTGRPWVLTPTFATGKEHLAAVRRLVSACGAVAVETDPEAHDRAMALVSHVPHVLAVLAAARLHRAEPAAVALAGTGVGDVTRVAAGDPSMWAGILAGNAGPVAELLAAVRDDLDEVLSGLADPARLSRVLARGAAGRARLPGKHGGAPARWTWLPVVAPDEPGALARLFADAGAVGINVEDVRIEHSPGQRVGQVGLAVRPVDADGLSEALVARGWTVQR